MLWLLGQRGEAEEKVTEDEIRTLVVEAENAGVLEPGEKEMIAGVMRLGDLPVGAVMTPRHEVSMIDLSRPGCRYRRRAATSNHSRFPVFDGDRDSALGIVQAKDLLDVYPGGPDAGYPRTDPRGAGHSRSRRCARRRRDPEGFARAHGPRP